MIGTADTVKRELVRILWRQEIMRDQKGVAWLASQVKSGAKDKDLGPHRADYEQLERKKNEHRIA